jgi:hypothetical protein
MKFTYSSGQRPLEGYTIKRGIGQGGFGEVYYALSDGGKEVALKLVRSNLEVELRGMTQCLNLKHPNLVHLFDLRTDAEGNSWVVMEYVAGESLSAVLARHPQGVGPELARQWFLGLAAAVGYLHDHGIVHRDLKPGNIFLENGSIKVGDYGLCKFMGGSQRTGQTQSIGTVHYMAPEISTGNYNRQVDIYAAGIILYEMLTGHVPFDGESAGEILMKHLTSPPDLSAVPPPFVPMLDRALAKNTARRYRSMGEMAREVENVGKGQGAREVGREAKEERQTPLPAQPAPLAPGSTPLTPRRQVAELCTAMVLAVVLAGLSTLAGAAVIRTSEWSAIGACFFLAVSCSWAVLVPAKCWVAPAEDSWKRRAVLMGLGLLIGLEALWLEGYSWPAPETAAARAAGDPDGKPISFFRGLYPDSQVLPLAGYLSYFGLIFFIMRWWKLAERRRPERFSLFGVLVTAFWAYMLYFFLPGPVEWQSAFLALVPASVIVQLVSPWERPVPATGRRMRLRYA